MPGDADQIRGALQCDRPRCPCHRARGRLHCPVHDADGSGNPDISLQEKDGTLLIHCHVCGPTGQEALIEALRVRGLWEGAPSPGVRAAEFRDTLTRVYDLLTSYVQFPTIHVAVGATLWVAHTWAIDASDTTAYLGISSPVKRAGKSRLQELLTLLTPRAWGPLVQPSEAVLYRVIHQRRPTLFVDELDATWQGRSEDAEPLRAVFNAGFRRGAVVPRCLAHGDKVVNFEVFCPKCFAYIGEAPETLTDRSIVLRMVRATSSEQRALKKLRRKTAEAETAPLRDELAAWAQRAIPRLKEADPAMPDELDGRACDLWSPLLAIGELAGNGWSVLALQAAVALSGRTRDEDSWATKLLADLQVAFGEAPRMTTANILMVLNEKEDSPWGDWHGRPLTPHGLARLLRKFGVKPVHWREGNETQRGYVRAGALEDAFSHWLPDADTPQEAAQPTQPTQNGELVPGVPLVPVSTGSETKGNGEFPSREAWNPRDGDYWEEKARHKAGLPWGRRA